MKFVITIRFLHKLTSIHMCPKFNPTDGGFGRQRQFDWRADLVLRSCSYLKNWLTNLNFNIAY